MMEDWQAIVATVAGAGVVLGAIRLWIAPVVRAAAKIAELHPTWVQIGEAYKQRNGDPPLHEQIEAIEGKMEELDRKLEVLNRVLNAHLLRVDSLESKIDAFVVQRLVGGRRNTDPGGI